MPLRVDETLVWEPLKTEQCSVSRFLSQNKANCFLVSIVGVAWTKDFGCNTDLCSDHKFRHQLYTKEFKGEVNQEIGRVIKMGIKLRSFINKS